MALSVGDAAPDFELPRTLAEGDTVKLSDFRGKRNVLLCFYPFDFSSVCSEQLPAYQAEKAKFDAADCEVIGISVDSPFAHAAWAEKYGIEFPLLSDFFGKGTCAAYGFLNDKGFSNRAVVLVNKDGNVAYMEVTAAPPEKPDDDKLFAAVEGLG